MNLSFQQKWPKRMGPELAGKPNYFIQKIWSGFAQHGIVRNDFDSWYDKTERHGINLNIATLSKIHTIRVDKHDRWKAGNKIHFQINPRMPQQFQFAPVVKCVSVQEIEIKYREHITYPDIYIDGIDLWENDLVSEISINDGFPGILPFLNYFNKDFKGKIIHWTDLRY